MFIVLTTLTTTVGGRGFSEVAVWALGRDQRTALGGSFRHSMASVITVGLAGAAAAALVLPFQIAILVLPASGLLQFFRATTGVRLAVGEVARFNVERTVLPIATTAGISFAWLFRLDSPVGGYLGGQFVAACAVLPIAKAAGLFEPGPSLGAVARRIGRQSVVGNTLGSSLSRVDILAVGLLADPVATGIYSVALSAGEIALTGAYALSFHALRDGAESGALGDKTLSRALWLTMALAIGAGIGLAALGEPLLGPGFGDVWFTFLLLIPGIICIAAVRLRFSSDLTSGRGAGATRALGAAVVILVMLDVALVPSLGADGASIASTAAYGSALVLLLRWRGPTPLEREEGS